MGRIEDRIATPDLAAQDAIAARHATSGPVDRPSDAQTSIQGIGPVPPHTGDLPSPLWAYWYVPQGVTDPNALAIGDSTLRGWAHDAATYHGVPPELFAAILQNENGPNATALQQTLQFGERSLTTFADIVDRTLFGIVPDGISGGSSGIANMSRNALLGATDYVENTLGRAVMPAEVSERIGGWNQDTRISGDDVRSDLYYSAAHVRELIDRVTGVRNYSGPLTLEQARDVAAAYNGSGPAATRYGDDAISNITDAIAGREPLYFYQPPGR